MTADEIIECVCSALELDKEMLLSSKGGSRKLRYADARHISAYIIRNKVKHTKVSKKKNADRRGRQVRISFIEIGKIFQKKHNSIMHSVNTCEAFLKINNEFKGKYEKVLSCLNAAA